MKEEVIEIDVKDIKNFPNHPFKITNDLNYKELRNSILKFNTFRKIKSLKPLCIKDYERFFNV